jgi:DNA polymerase I
MSTGPLILVDGSSWLFRAYHALPPLTNARGEPTGAVFGMYNMLKRLLKDYAPERFCVVFDPSGKTFREDWYPEYKANRGETPEDLKSQFPRVTELIQAMGLPVFAVDGVEADDVIGTLAQQARQQGLDVVIVTSDKDMAQLVDDHVHLLDTMKNRRMDPAGVVEKFGVKPEQIIDYLALMGDTSDNIPGVHGVGPKTAAKWLNEYGSLDALVAQADAIKGKAGENLRAALDHLPLSKRLTTIVCDVELPVPLDSLRPGERDEDAMAALFERLGFKPERAARAVEAVVPDGEPAPAPAEPAASPANAQPTAVRCITTEADFDALIAALEAAELICLDTETDALDAQQAGLVGLAFAVKAGEGWYLPLAHNYMGAPAQLPMEAVLQRLKPLLEDPRRPKLGQHLKYDLNVLRRHGISVQGVAHDTMLQSYVLDAAGHRHDMDTLAKRYLDHTTTTFSDIAGKGKAQLTFNQVALEQAAPYSAEDADITLRLHEALHPRLTAEPALDAVYRELEMPLVPVLADMEYHGVGVDVPLLRRISTELAQRMETLEKDCHEAAGQPFNLGSPKQLGAILFDQLGLRVVSKTPKGEPSTAEDVLEVLAEEHPLPRLILEWRSVSKLRSTYTETLPQMVNPKTGRIHTSYHQAVAATGRLSSSDPNLQNIPIRTDEGRRIRQAFVPAEGCSLLSIDYSQIELRLMAHFSGDEKLLGAFRAGQDIHRATAAEVFGVDLEAVSSEQRRAAKAINFGLIYGISAFGLARNIGVGRNEAAEIIERFFTRYPGVKAFMDGTREQARERGYVETLRGRRLYLPNINARNAAQRQYAERTAINAPLQGTAADLIKAAMLDVHAFLAREAPAVRMIMQVHDELVFEGPTDTLKALAQPLSERMCRSSALTVPLVAEPGLGDNWDASHG